MPEPEKNHLDELTNLPEAATDALSVAADAVEQLRAPLTQTAIPDDALFANAIAGAACFGLAHQHLRAALLLLRSGAYEAVPVLLRAAFEAAECGQYVSKDPGAAEKWIERPTSWPSKEVRSRLGDRTRHGPYGPHYGMLSTLSHPTARAGMSAVELDADALRVSDPRADPEPETVHGLAVFVASTAVFACFAFINANPEGATDPRWRRTLKRLTDRLVALAGSDWDTAHLEEDWDAAHAEWQRITRHIRSPDELDAALAEHPASWHRAMRAAATASEESSGQTEMP